MINQVFNYNISGGTAPYTWDLTTTNSCITFSESGGTLSADGIISFTIFSEDENCFQNAITTLTVSYVKQGIECSSAEILPVSNPCGSLVVPNIVNNNFTFSLLPTGGVPNYSYDWVFDTTLFNPNNGTGNILNLEWNPQVSPLPETTTVSTTVTDSAGCSKSVTNTFTLPVPNALNVKATLPCYPKTNPCNGTHYGMLILPVSSTIDIDWSTLVVSDPGNTCITNNEDGTIFFGYDGTAGTSLVLSWTVANTLGIESNTGTLFINIPICVPTLDTCYFIGQSDTLQLLATDAVTDVKTLDITDRITSSDTIDWTTFTIINAPVFGTAALNGSQQLAYTITDITTTTNIPDSVKWSVTNECGKTLTVTDLILRDVIAAPVTVGEFICAVCNTPTAATDITANDTGDIDKSTITITSLPTDVIYTKDNNNDFIFTAIPDTSLTRILQYTVDNSQGITSNTSNIILSTTYAGTANNQDITCWTTKTFDLLNYFTDANALNYAFVETTAGATTYLGQGGVIGAATGSVDFTAITAGTYTFELTAFGTGVCVATTDTETLTITVGETPALTLGTVDNANGTFTATYTTDGVASLSYFTITKNAGTVDYVTSPSFDANGDGSFIFNAVTTDVLQIVVTTVCGTTITQSITL